MKKWFGVRRNDNIIHRLPDLVVFGYDDNTTFFMHDHHANCTRDFSSFKDAERFAKYAKLVYQFCDFYFRYVLWRMF